MFYKREQNWVWLFLFDSIEKLDSTFLSNQNKKKTVEYVEWYQILSHLENYISQSCNIYTESEKYTFCHNFFIKTILTTFFILLQKVDTKFY